MFKTGVLVSIFSYSL